MTDSEITALAREYAEEEAKGTAVESLPDGFKEYVIQRNANQFEKHLRWLLRRFCLVEKEAVRKEYHEIKLALGDGGHSEWEDDINMEKEALLKSLFPEIAKEVQS